MIEEYANQNVKAVTVDTVERDETSPTFCPAELAIRSWRVVLGGKRGPPSGGHTGVLLLAQGDHGIQSCCA